ncbi:DsrE family protein [Algibacter sp. L4_22]|uniref:DsrE family protein n=1 Tax=Algibacter sp. L4_22 TaxID=2942477 RepID=UPI00201B70CD|nr:DsrE family protein [Algibacter sp. L4_22]MCL5129645.1 DsrE family protein [Algibacter sp. L4_22]
MQIKFQYLFIFVLFLIQVNFSFAQTNKPTTGPVFDNIGPVFSVENLDLLPDPAQDLKAIFDIDSKQTDASKINYIIASLHRYYNMHVRYGIPKENIHLALVLHGGSTKDALSSNVYNEKFKVENPNEHLIKSLSDIGVDVFVCGQSMSYSGYNKADLLPEVKVALSAMSVLTVYQMNNFSLIKF